MAWVKIQDSGTFTVLDRIHRFQVLESLIGGGHDQRRILIHRGPVHIHGLLEFVEIHRLGGLIIGLCIYFGSLGIGVTPNLLDFTIGLRANAVQFAFSVAVDSSRLTVSLQCLLGRIQVH